MKLTIKILLDFSGEFMTLQPKIVKEMILVCQILHLVVLNYNPLFIGTQYRSVIFYHDEDQKNDAHEVLKEIEEKKVFKDPIVTAIVPFTNFYEAEEYHQDYLTKNPDGYCNHKFYW